LSLPKALIVSGQPLVTIALADWLGEGFVVLGAVPYRLQSVPIIETARPDLVVLDLSVHPQVGLALARELRARRLEVILLSSNGEVDTVTSARERRAAGLPARAGQPRDAPPRIAKRRPVGEVAASCDGGDQPAAPPSSA
jgi:DNA-binding NarL/FixJ family response regulator